MNHCSGRPSPLREGGDVVSEGSVVYLVNKYTEEGGGLVARIGLQLGVDLDYKGGGYSRKKTGLMP